MTVGELTKELRRGDVPRFTWRSIDRKHWQITHRVADESAAPAKDAAALGVGCPSGMVRVSGAFRREASSTAGAIERLQDAACTDWISRDFPARCRAFDRDKIAAAVASFPEQPLDYCIDRFEYPNAFGAYPVIVVTFREAEALCQKAEKRLCTEDEWTFACEGEEVRPYPYGWSRDDGACVIDRSWRPFGENALQPRDGERAREELDRLWQGEASGTRAACRSPFGVEDMTGNVDEWARSVRPTGYTSVLKGGYWGPVRARCRPSTRAHNEDFVAYQQGFRCCAEADRTRPAHRAAAPAAAPVPASDATREAPPVKGLDVERPESDDEVDAIANERTRGCAAGVSDRATTSPGLGVLVVVAALRRRKVASLVT